MKYVIIKGLGVRRSRRTAYYRAYEEGHIRVSVETAQGTLKSAVDSLDLPYIDSVLDRIAEYGKRSVISTETRGLMDSVYDMYTIARAVVEGRRRSVDNGENEEEPCTFDGAPPVSHRIDRTGRLYDYLNSRDYQALVDAVNQIDQALVEHYMPSLTKVRFGVRMYIASGQHSNKSINKYVTNTNLSRRFDILIIRSSFAGKVAIAVDGEWQGDISPSTRVRLVDTLTALCLVEGKLLDTLYESRMYLQKACHDYIGSNSEYTDPYWSEYINPYSARTSPPPREEDVADEIDEVYEYEGIFEEGEEGTAPVQPPRRGDMT